jgi:hypothetical protein
MRMRLLPWLGLLVIGATACASPLWPSVQELSDPEANLERHRERFEDAIGDSYRVTYQTECFCPLELQQSVRMTVRDGEITEIVRRSDGFLIPRAQWPAYRTVDQIFDEILEGIDNGAQVTVEYDPRYGYPRDTLVDYNIAADAFVGYELSDLDKR